jgi:hypothetical protein
MPLSLTCDCGARFELEEALAGQSVSCPECQATLKAPAAPKPAARTHLFALASALLALVGAFTVVGTAAAVVLGLLGLVAILRDRERWGGLGFALFGVVWGAAFTALTLWALSDPFGFQGSLRRAQMVDQLEPTDPKALEVKQGAFSIALPSAKWAKAKKDFVYFPVQPLFRDEAVLLVQPDLNAFVDVQVASDPNEAIQAAINSRLREAAPSPGPTTPPKVGPKGPPAADPDEGPEPIPRLSGGTSQTLKRLAPGDGETEAGETEAEVKCDNKAWKLLIQVHRARNGKLYIVRGFCEASRFGRLKGELRKAVESFRLTP